eukprot:5620660-Pleurochrysis_carterae.AAC.2
MDTTTNVASCSRHSVDARGPWQHQLATAYMEYCLLALLGPGSIPTTCFWLWLCLARFGSFCSWTDELGSHRPSNELGSLRLSDELGSLRLSHELGLLRLKFDELGSLRVPDKLGLLGLPMS